MTEENKSSEPTERKATVTTTSSPKLGALVTGTIVKVTGAVAFVNYGARNEGYIELAEFADQGGESVKEGDTVTAEIISTKGGVQLSYKKAQNHQRLEALKQAIESQTPALGKVSGVNKGGFDVHFDGIRGFCPASQISLKPVTEPEKLVGQTFEFLMTEFTRKGGFVVSRRRFLDTQRKAAQATLAEKIKPGDRLQGTVTQIKDFGVFVALAEGVEGLVHVSELSHDRSVQPAAIANVGDAVEVAVLRVDADKGRVSLSFKQLEADPWAAFIDGHEAGQTVQGFVTRVQDFGVFVKLATGVEGLLHVSAIKAHERVESAEGIYQAGEEIAVVIDSIDGTKRRISLFTPEVAAARQPIEVAFKVGDVFKGKVKKVEKFGVLLDLEDGNVGMIPNVEMGTSRGTDHFRMFPVASELEVKVLEIDLKRRRIRLSRKALLNHDEEHAFAEYKKQAAAPSSLGSFGDLLSKHLKNQDD
jgi:small subunit ribosomal protein S1